MSINPARDPSTKTMRSLAIEYASPPLSATISIIPWFPGFIKKSALQLGRKPPPIFRMHNLWQGSKAAPTIGGIVGVQMIAESFFRKTLFKEESSRSAFASALLVGSISAPLLAIFNGKTMGMTTKESLHALSRAQGGAIVLRETSFIASFPLSSILAKTLKEYAGDHAATQHIAAFASGFLGSLVGHPADTALTLWQQGMRIQKPTHLLRGALSKSIAVGGFAMTYQALQSTIASTERG